MFEQLFGSKTRVKLLRLFLENQDKRFFVRELTRLTDSMINSIRRELDNLIDLKLILVEEAEPVTEQKADKRGLNIKKFYYLNKKNLFLPDLVNLFSKGNILIERKLVEKIQKLGEIKYISVGGTFVDDAKAETDVFVVGDLDVAKMKACLAKFEEEIGRPIRYTVMDENEYRLRHDIADGFLEDILSNSSNVVVVDRLKRKKKNTEHYE